MNDDPIRRSEPLRLDVAEPSPVVRVVLAEIDSPGPLHYLIEGEGFQIVGCASNDVDLARVLAHMQPDVIVLDADISASCALVAREKAPSSELIVLWPDGVQLPSGAEQVHPRLVYQDLGPAIRRAADDRRARHPIVVEPDDDDLDAPTSSASVDVLSSTAQRTSTRVLVGTAALIALIVLTMGASFALEGRSGSPQPSAVRSNRTSPPSAVAGPRPSATSPPSRTGGAPASVHTRCAPGAKTDRHTPNEHAAVAAHGAPPACASHGPGSTRRPPHQRGNHRGHGPSTGGGNAIAKGSGNVKAKGGNVNAKGAGTAKTKDSGAQGRSHGHPTKAPAGPPATHGAARNGPPG